MTHPDSTSGTSPALAEGDYPAIFRQADHSSRSAQQKFLVATAGILLSVSLAAVMGAVSATWAGWVGAAAFLGAIVVGALAVTQNLERAWYDGRALAESAKSLTWLYVARGGYLANPPDADQELQARLRAIRDELKSLDFVIPIEGLDVTQRMRDFRQAPLNQRRELYCTERLADQIRYYRARSEQHSKSARTFRIAAWAAQTFGLVGAALKGLDVLKVDLLGIGAAGAAAFAAWLQTRDHVTLARAYRLTAEDLERVREDLPSSDGESEWGAYVADAEAAMSREHVMWLARRGRVGESRGGY